MSSSYTHQSNGQVKVCIKFVDHTMKKYFYTNKDVNLALLQISSAPFGHGVPSLATILSNRLIRDVLPTTNRMSKLYNYHDEYYDALKWR